MIRIPHVLAILTFKIYDKITRKITHRGKVTMRLKNRFNALKDYQIYELQNKFIVMNVYCAKGLFLRLEHVTKQPINLRLSTAQLSSPIAEIPQGFRFFFIKLGGVTRSKLRLNKSRSGRGQSGQCLI